MSRVMDIKPPTSWIDEFILSTTKQSEFGRSELAGWYSLPWELAGRSDNVGPLNILNCLHILRSMSWQTFCVINGAFKAIQFRWTWSSFNAASAASTACTSWTTPTPEANELLLVYTTSVFSEVISPRNPLPKIAPRSVWGWSPSCAGSVLGWMPRWAVPLLSSAHCQWRRRWGFNFHLRCAASWPTAGRSALARGFLFFLDFGVVGVVGVVGVATDSGRLPGSGCSTLRWTPHHLRRFNRCLWAQTCQDWLPTCSFPTGHGGIGISCGTIRQWRILR